MPNFGSTSRERLKTCHVQLQQLFERVVKTYDCSILCGQRNEEDQNKAFDEGRSKVRFPNGKHNGNPSLAVDAAPYPLLDWNDRGRFMHFGGYVQGVAAEMGIPIRWGGDWDSDFDFKDQTFDDLVHFEMK